MRTSATESKYSSAVVKSGKLYVVQRYVNQLFRIARPMLEGRRFEFVSNYKSR
ncbi:hypothetical protein CCYN2B_90035 [Capnocytophaga cynodegmi]|uniref:Uncharacterized protein n=1 Tax=Capnocytophaga cynodegmi TaxID=28189 RepID=A0A0B7HQ71_9FLAO|nr:hypothetical protein CCYN2B_90035 [Capnocytophaga cynodegmi]